jgi:predicted enzyme related to lactoylglutathione lyase
MIDDIVGVNIFTARLEEMVAFYRDTLGLRLHSDHGDFIAFEVRPGMRLNIGRHSQVWAAENADPYRVMLNLSTGDIRALYERMRARGVAFLRPPEQEGWGGWVATFQDPDGNILQLFQMPQPKE